MSAARKVPEGIAGRPSRRLEHPAALARGQHVPLHDLAHDPRGERIAPRLGHQPAVPLELIERAAQLVAAISSVRSSTVGAARSPRTAADTSTRCATG